MKNSITEIAELITRSFEENFEKMLTEKKDISEFVIEVKKTLDQVGTVLAKEALEMMDSLVKCDSRRKQNWYVHEKSAPNTLATIFGEVHYHRTYYKHKTQKDYRYLSDELVGIDSYDKMDVSLKARLIEEAIDTPYARSGRKAAETIEVSSQSVMNAIRELGPVSSGEVKSLRAKETPKILYIEADEDHVAHRNKGVRSFEQRLVYVHEGSVSVGKGRHKLLGKKYFTFPPGTKTEEIWNTVWHYLDDTYDLERTEHIFILGDGAAWIKAGAGYIPDSHYVMDGFHLHKAISRADDENRKALSQAIQDGKWALMNHLLISLREEAKLDSRKKAIFDVQKYLDNNWPGIQARRKYQGLLVGCSAEGHVSHVLSARLSSRPMGWSYLGANQMAHLRVHSANGIDIGQAYIKQSASERKLYVHDQLPKQTVSSVAKAVGSNLKTIDNIPSLGSGTKSFAPLLRTIAHCKFDI